MYITDFSNNSVSIYSQNANCNCAPNLLVQGPNTGLSGPAGVAVDASRSVYVANENASTITKYSGSLSGNIAPSFTIPAASSGLNSPIGIAVDASGKVYVANSASAGGVPSIEVFTSGATAPSQTITGTITGLSTPGFLTLDSTGNIWVGNLTGNSVEEFANGANGAAAPSATISGSRTLLSRPQGIAFDSSGRLYVAINNSLGFNDAVLVYTPPLGGNQAPSNILCGTNTGVNNPTGLAVNSLGTLFVVNSAFGGSAGYMAIFAANNIGGGTGCTGPFPNATVGGSNSSLLNPAGVALH
jgi:serine/threonine-protein kinase